MTDLETIIYSPAERLLLEQIRLKVARFELAQLRKAKLPTTDKVLSRITAAAWASAEKKVPWKRKRRQ